MGVSTVKIPAVRNRFFIIVKATAEIDLHPEGIDNLQMAPCHRVCHATCAFTAQQQRGVCSRCGARWMWLRWRSVRRLSLGLGAVGALTRAAAVGLTVARAL